MGLFFLLAAISFVLIFTNNYAAAKYMMYATVPVFLVAWIRGVVYVYKINKKAYENFMGHKPIFTDSVFNANEKINDKHPD